MAHIAKAIAGEITVHPEKIPQHTDMPTLFRKCIVGTATKKQEEDFKKMWQEKVRIVLFEEAKSLFEVE